MSGPAQLPLARKYASELAGLTLPSGWRVLNRFERGPDPTGSVFSEGYVVESDSGRHAFLKALDISAAFDSDDPTAELEAMTSAFNYERQLLERCRDRRMDRVVLAVEHGNVLVDPRDRLSLVPYIIFELAEGDVRKHLDLSREFDVRWALRALHHIATGLLQLHRERIAHQDLKPSNVMMFAGGRDAKIGDLGRASTFEKAGHFDDRIAPGDRRYAPPEQWYNAVPDEWKARRVGSDAYHLGSMIAFMFTGLSMTALWYSELVEEHRPGRWTGSFADVLPYLRDAFDRAVEQVENQMPDDVRSSLGTMLRRLCDPDPSRRGHPAERATKHGDRQSVARFVTELDLVARRAEAGVISRVRET